MKILIIASNALSDTQNNGKTVKSFLHSVPKNDIAQLYFGTNENPDREACDNYYRVTEIDQLKCLLRFSFKTTNTHASLLIRNSGIVEEKSLVRNLKKNGKTLAPFREILWRLNTWDTRELDAWITKFRPDVIFAVLGDGMFGHRIVRLVSDRYKIPFAAYFTDDYYINDSSANLLQRIHYKQLCKTYRETVKKAALCYTIGTKMSVDYAKTFGREFGELVNAVDFSKFSRLSTGAIDLEKEILISFIGGIHLNRWKSIARVGRLVQEINLEYNTNIRIEVFTIVKPDKDVLNAFSQANVQYCGSLTETGVLDQIEKSQMLLHVESFDEKNRLYTRYSISTKIPEYLASKRGIIAYGPPEIASIQIFKNNNWGCCLADLDDDETMKQKLVSYMESFDESQAMGAYNYAYSTFNRETVSQNLIQDLTKISELNGRI